MTRNVALGKPDGFAELPEEPGPCEPTDALPSRSRLICAIHTSARYTQTSRVCKRISADCSEAIRFLYFPQIRSRPCEEDR
jgi:hypothetical protein